MAHAGKKLKGWFKTDGRPGDRSFDQQLLGLDRLFAVCAGKTVLDVGCAEGLISIELARRGATAVLGVEVRADHVAVGRKLVGDLPVTLEVQDVNEWAPRRKFDIVVALAILHKLKNPSAVARLLATHCNDLIVLRLPPATAPVVIDSRSNNVTHDIGVALRSEGFELMSAETSGPFGEWVGYYLRTK